MGDSAIRASLETLTSTGSAAPDPLRSIFLPWCSQQGIKSASELSSRLLDRFSADLLENGGKRGALSRHTVWTYVKAVKLFLDWARAEGEAIEAEARLPKLPKHVVEILSREEIQALEDAAKNERDSLIVRMLADTGIRNGELVGLRVTDLVERDRNYYAKVLGKGSRERLVPLTPALYRRIRRYIERKRPRETASDRLFVSRRRGLSGDYEPLTPSGIQQLVRDLGAKAGLSKRVHPHVFRHSAATYMLQRGMDSLLVAQILGHSSLAMIQRVYAHMTPTDAHSALMRVLRTDDR